MATRNPKHHFYCCLSLEDTIFVGKELNMLREYVRRGFPTVTCRYIIYNVYTCFSFMLLGKPNVMKGAGVPITLYEQLQYILSN